MYIYKRRNKKSSYGENGMRKQMQARRPSLQTVVFSKDIAKETFSPDVDSSATTDTVQNEVDVIFE